MPYEIICLKIVLLISLSLKRIFAVVISSSYAIIVYALIDFHNSTSDHGGRLIAAYLSELMHDIH